MTKFMKWKEMKKITTLSPLPPEVEKIFIDDWRRLISGKHSRAEMHFLKLLKPFYKDKK